MSILKTLAFAGGAAFVLTALLSCSDEGDPGKTSAESEKGDDKPMTEVKALTWLHTLDEALAEAKKSHSMIVVDAYADWCGWCKKLDKDTLSNPKVREKLQDFVLLKLDTDAHPEDSRRFGVEGLPTTLILDENGKVIASQAGYMPPDEYIKFLSKAKK